MAQKNNNLAGAVFRRIMYGRIIKSKNYSAPIILPYIILQAFPCVQCIPWFIFGCHVSHVPRANVVTGRLCRAAYFVVHPIRIKLTPYQAPVWLLFRKMFKIVQILMPTGCQLIGAQIGQRNSTSRSFNHFKNSLKSSGSI